MTTILFSQLQAIVAVESSSDVTCWAGATRGQVRPVTINTDLSHHYHIQHSAPATTASPTRGRHALFVARGAGGRPGEDLPSRHTLLIALPLFVNYYVVGTHARNVGFVRVSSLLSKKSKRAPKMTSV